LEPDPAKPELPHPVADNPPPAADTWHSLRRYTSARIALGHTGGSVRTETLLDFRLAHARARDAVSMDFHADNLAAELALAGFATFSLTTAATDRQTFLVRPDQGRLLSAASRAALEHHRTIWGRRHLALIVSNGLSALAAERQALPTIAALVPLLRANGWTLFPIFVAPYSRVKLQDEIGEILFARHTLMLLGERPGLGSPDSLGAYFTFQPGEDCTDADRNCVSNIRPEGLAPVAAAHKLAELLFESARLSLSGVALKDTGMALPGPPPVSP
jgi:ethanolamine ammonia-lyase small subunit